MNMEHSEEQKSLAKLVAAIELPSISRDTAITTLALEEWFKIKVDHANFSICCKMLCDRIEAESIEAGDPVIACQVDKCVKILSHADAAEYCRRQRRHGANKIKLHYKKDHLAVDTSGFSPEQLARRDRDLRTTELTLREAFSQRNGDDLEITRVYNPGNHKNTREQLIALLATPVKHEPGKIEDRQRDVG
jgi:hypothetical protein